ncbi:hypothetical protein AB0L56_00060 [Streptomyces sp. NPDC052079]|uniref:hypothetical protein n=1 Tax=Streptomyces sp. NPDC052079 TaxID=3155526 RepID=UPI0034390A15
MEHIVVSAGRVKAGPGEESAELRPGDYMSYRANVPLVPPAYEAFEPGTQFVMILQHIRDAYERNAPGIQPGRRVTEKAGAPFA